MVTVKKSQKIVFNFAVAGLVVVMLLLSVGMNTYAEEPDQIKCKYPKVEDIKDKDGKVIGKKITTEKKR